VGKDLVIAKTADSALHYLCDNINMQCYVAQKIKVLPEVGDANMFLVARGITASIRSCILCTTIKAVKRLEGYDEVGDIDMLLEETIASIRSCIL